MLMHVLKKNLNQQRWKESQNEIEYFKNEIHTCTEREGGEN